MNCNYTWFVLTALLSAGLPWQAAIAASPSSLIRDSLIQEASLEGTAETTGVYPTEQTKATAASATTPEVAALLEKPSQASSGTPLAGLPFTDIERRQTTIHNSGNTAEPWLSPESRPSEAPLESPSEQPLAEPPLELRDPEAVSQTPTVDGLSDVEPDSWAFRALRSLVEDYGCIVGYPDGTFRGDQATTRLEFAAGVYACLEQITELLPEDRDTVGALQRRFAPELAELATDIDLLEATVAELQENQFSTTTRLFGQVIFGVQGRNDNTADFFPVDGIAETEDPGGGTVTLFSNAQLFLLSRFSRRDLLFIGLQAGDGNSLFNPDSGEASGLTNNIRLAYESDTSFDVELSDLTYRRLIGDRFALVVGATGLNQVSVFRGPSEEESAGSGPLSLFAQRNPILSIGSGEAGIGFDWQIMKRLSLQGVYTVPQLEASSSDEGLFEGDRTLGFQITATPFDTLNLSLNYINDFSEFGSLGTGIGDSQVTAGDDITTNAFGGTLAWAVTPQLTIGGWGGHTISTTPGEPGSVKTLNWMAFLNFPDLLGPGNLGGIYVGQPPRISSSTLTQGQNIPDLLAGGFGDPGDQPGETLHIEAFYRYQMTDNISLTPGFIVLLDPANTPESENIVIGALRTTFRF